MADISWHIYIVGTVVGLLPEIFLLCYFGTTLRSLQDIVNGNLELDVGQILFLVIGVIIAVVLFVLLMRLGKESMNDIDTNTEQPSISIVEEGGFPMEKLSEELQVLPNSIDLDSDEES